MHVCSSAHINSPDPKTGWSHWTNVETHDWRQGHFCDFTESLGCLWCPEARLTCIYYFFYRLRIWWFIFWVDRRVVWSTEMSEKCQKSVSFEFFSISIDYSLVSLWLWIDPKIVGYSFDLLTTNIATEVSNRTRKTLRRSYVHTVCMRVWGQLNQSNSRVLYRDLQYIKFTNSAAAQKYHSTENNCNGVIFSPVRISKNTHFLIRK